MLCEKCQKNPATVHMQHFMHGVKKEMHLCQECSFKLEMPISLENIFQGFMEQFNSTYFGQTPTESKAKQCTMATCTSCLLTYEEFKKGMKLGCDTCYKTFKGSIEALLKNVQGSTRHSGKYPQRTGAGILQQRQANQLRVHLQQAIAEENFEEAARLRDEIRNLEVTGA